MWWQVSKKEQKTPIDKTVIPIAYSLAPDPDHPGHYFAIEMHNVVAEKVVHLEPNQRAVPLIFQLNRMYTAIQQRSFHHKWGGDKK